jgi:hypothetical protein
MGASEKKFPGVVHSCDDLDRGWGMRSRVGLLVLIILLLLALPIILSSCGVDFPWKSAAAVSGSLEGTLHPWTESTPIAGRRIVLCLSQGDPRQGYCQLMERSVTSDAEGHFLIEDVPQGLYFVLYDSGLNDFDQALENWGGKILHFGDREWLAELLGVEPDQEWVIHRVPEGISPSPHQGWLSAYCGLTLLVGNSPFIIVHDMAYARDAHELHCQIVDIHPAETSHVDAYVVYFGE